MPTFDDDEFAYPPDGVMIADTNLTIDPKLEARSPRGVQVAFTFAYRTEADSLEPSVTAWVVLMEDDQDKPDQSKLPPSEELQDLNNVRIVPDTLPKHWVFSDSMAVLLLQANVPTPLSSFFLTQLMEWFRNDFEITAHVECLGKLEDEGVQVHVYLKRLNQKIHFRYWVEPRCASAHFAYVGKPNSM